MGFCSGEIFERYASNIVLRSAVERQVGIVAEALLQLDQIDPEIFERVPDARLIASLRDYLVQGYAQIDNQKVWAFVQNDVDGLRTAVARLLANA